VRSTPRATPAGGTGGVALQKGPGAKRLLLHFPIEARDGFLVKKRRLRLSQKPSKPSDTLPYVLPIIHTELIRDVNLQDLGLIQALLEGVGCARCHAKALGVTSTLVARPFITSAGKRLVLAVPLARCGACRSRRRVLPSDALPYKQFSLGRIEKVGRDYLSSARSLRATTAAAAGEHTPHYSTLHGWLGGLGERALDQISLGRERATPDGETPLVPFTAVIEESMKQTGEPTVRAFSAPVHVRAGKYRSDRRREHLEACLRVFAMAAVIPSDSADGKRGSIVDLESVAIQWFRMPVLLFRSRIRDTPIQHPKRRPERYRSPSGSGGSPSRESKEGRSLALRADRRSPRRLAHGPRAARPPPKDRPCSRALAVRR
jgi:hypothetical protein